MSKKSMVRQKVILGNYIFIVDFFKAGEDLLNPTYKSFYVLRDLDFMSGILSDRHIYFIDKEKYKKNTIYPINEVTSVGYSTNVSEFNSNMNDENLDKNLYHLYIKKSDNTFKEKPILCDMIRIYFPTIKNKLDAIIDIENYINDIKFHYLISDINDFERKSKNEMKIDHQLYSEYIDIYIPSINTLLYDDNIYINEYNNCVSNGESINETYDDKSIIKFQYLYYPYEILTERNESEKPIFSKNFINSANYINNQLYNTLNLIVYPFLELDSSNMFILNDVLNINSTNFNLNIETHLNTEIRFPLSTDFNDEEDYNRYYGVPCAISTFNINTIFGNTIQEKYLKLNGLTIDDYEEYDPENNEMINYKDEDDDYFGEELWEIKKTGFFIEMATDRRFKNVFFKYKVNINDTNTIIDNFTFPLSGIFSNWNDIPNIIICRITFIDKVACNKIQSNPVIITNEWYKYITNETITSKLHLRKVYKNVNNNMIVGKYNDNESPILFIDKINCSIIKNSANENDGMEIVKKNAPKIIYKPVFYRTSDLQNIIIKAGLTQNIGINLDEYMTKVETFKLIIGNNEYIEFGRNNLFVIFKINATKLVDSTGKYIITDENNEYIADGNYSIN